MKYTPDAAGFGTGVMGGQVAQHTRFGPIVRQRPRQSPHAALPAYLGSIFTSNPGISFADWDRRRLRLLSDYWADTLTGGQRSDWQALAPGILNGFETFQLINKVAGPAFGDFDDPYAHIQDLPYALAPAAWTPPPTPFDVSAQIIDRRFTFLPVAVFFLSGVTIPARFRVLVNNHQAYPGSQPGDSWIAIATGDVMQNSHPDFAISGWGFLQFLPTSLASPQITNMQYNIQRNAAPFDFVNGPITLDHPANYPWLTLTPGRGYLQNGPQALDPDPAITNGVLDFNIVSDSTIGAPPTGFNDAGINIDTGVASTQINNASLNPPADGPLILGSRNFFTQPFELCRISRIPTQQFIDFGVPYTRTLGGPFRDQHYWYRILIVDQNNGTPSSPFDINITTGH